MEGYLREHTIGTILRSSAEIYRNHLVTFLLVIFLPLFPFGLMQEIAQRSNSITLLTIAIVLNVAATLFVYAAAAVCISDACVGNPVGAMRGFQKISGSVLGRLTVTNLLQMLALIVGFVFLVVPGLLFVIWLMFAPTIVVLEGTYGVAALKRSHSLGAGFHWRNARLTALWTIINAAIGGLIGGILGATIPHMLKEPVFGWIFVALQLAVLYPLFLISLVLAYYDLRVRKESYDTKALAEDLMR